VKAVRPIAAVSRRLVVHTLRLRSSIAIAWFPVPVGPRPHRLCAEPHGHEMAHMRIGRTPNVGQRIAVIVGTTNAATGHGRTRPPSMSHPPQDGAMPRKTLAKPAR